MADDLTRLRASWKAYKSHVTRLYHKIDDTLNTDVDNYTITTLRTTIDQLNAKKAKIVELDEKIAALTTDADGLTETMIEAGHLEDSITDQVAKVMRLILSYNHKWKDLSRTRPVNQTPLQEQIQVLYIG